jgi:hypothetical protein
VHDHRPARFIDRSEDRDVTETDKQFAHARRVNNHRGSPASDWLDTVRFAGPLCRRPGPSARNYFPLKSKEPLIHGIHWASAELLEECGFVKFLFMDQDVKRYRRRKDYRLLRATYSGVLAAPLVRDADRHALGCVTCDFPKGSRLVNSSPASLDVVGPVLVDHVAGLANTVEQTIRQTGRRFL